MLDTVQAADLTLDILRERVVELEQIGRENAVQLDALHEVIARATRSRQRAPRRLRTPAERIAAEAHATDTAPATLDDALAGLGRAVAARDPALEDV